MNPSTTSEGTRWPLSLVDRGLKPLRNICLSLQECMERRFYTIMFLVAALMFVSQAIISILFSYTWYDEAGYLYESWLICDQGWVPYRDMYIKTPPVLYYVYGPIQHLFGPSFYLGRLQSVIFCALMLVVVYKLATKLGGKMAGTVGVLLIITNTFLMIFYSTATPYALTTLFVMGSLYVYSSDLKNPLKTVISVVLMSFAFLTRQNMVPLLILLVGYIIITETDKRTIYAAIGTAIIFPLLILSPFLIMDFENTFSLVFGPMLAPFSSILSEPEFTSSMASNAYTGVSALISKLYLLFRIGSLRVLLKYYYFFFVLLFGILITATWGKSVVEKKALLQKYKLPALILIMFFVSFIVHVYWPNTAWVIYSLYSMPLAAAFVGIGISKIYQKIENGYGRKILIFILIFGLFLSVPASFEFSFISSPLQSSDSDIQRVQRAATVIEQYTQPDDKIFTIDNPHYVFLAKRVVFPPLTHRTVLYTTSNETTTVEKRHYYNLEMVDRWLSGEADAVIFQTELNRRILNNTKLLELIDRKLEEKYDLVATVEPADVLAYKRGQYAGHNDTISIYVRKDRAT